MRLEGAVGDRLHMLGALQVITLEPSLQGAEKRERERQRERGEGLQDHAGQGAVCREEGHLVVMASGSGNFCLYLKPSLACLWL